MLFQSDMSCISITAIYLPMRIAPITNQPEFYHIPLIIIVIYLNLFSIYLTLITNNKEFILI